MYTFSSDRSIAAADNAGLVSGIAPGTTEVVFVLNYTDRDYYTKEIERTCRVTVKDGKKAVITYDLNGGEYHSSKEDIIEEHWEGDVISIHEAPKRTGYTFRYWEGSHYQPGDLWTVSGDHTFTAVWKKNDPEEKEDKENTDIASPGNSSGVITCQAAGYPEGYAWNEDAKACQMGTIGADGVFRPISKVRAVNTSDKGIGRYVISLIISLLFAGIARRQLKQK
jgi:hypothetical protein